MGPWAGIENMCRYREHVHEGMKKMIASAFKKLALPGLHGDSVTKYLPPLHDGHDVYIQTLQ